MLHDTPGHVSWTFAGTKGRFSPLPAFRDVRPGHFPSFQLPVMLDHDISGKLNQAVFSLVAKAAHELTQ